MYRLLLHRINLQALQLHIKHLTQIHHHRLVKFLPEVRPEDLDEGDF
jgi:hypothetical protein